LFEEPAGLAITDGVELGIPLLGSGYELKSGVSLELAPNPSQGTYLSAKKKHGVPMMI
jgi:hypothetical protein